MAEGCNLLVVVADEMRRDAPDCYGGAAAMPALAGLGARGTVFERAYTPSPICVPARAAIATGRPVHETGHWDSAAPYAGRPESWMHRLRAAGMPVLSFGKLHFRNGEDDNGFTREVRPMHVAGGLGWTIALVRDGSADFDAARDLAADIGYGPSEYTDYDCAVTDDAATFLANPRGWLARETGWRGHGPWAAFVSLVSPHYPLVAPAAYEGRYDPAAVPAPIRPPDGLRHPEIARLAAFWDYEAHFDPGRAAAARAAYYALCSFVDDQLARLIAALEAGGEAERTLVIFLSDHGEMLGDHGFWTKSVMYEGSVGVPLVAAGPGLPAGRRVRTPVTLLDLYPTALAAAGLPESAPAPFARPLQTAAALPDEPGRAAFCEYHDGGSTTGAFMLRWDDWKYVAYAGERPQLFDLGADPEERHDLGADPGPRAAAARAEGAARLAAICDVEAVNTAAFADQARRMAALGGREACLRRAAFAYTPVPTS